MTTSDNKVKLQETQISDLTNQVQGKQTELTSTQQKLQTEGAKSEKAKMMEATKE